MCSYGWRRFAEDVKVLQDQETKEKAIRTEEELDLMLKKKQGAK